MHQHIQHMSLQQDLHATEKEMEGLVPNYSSIVGAEEAITHLNVANAVASAVIHRNMNDTSNVGFSLEEVVAAEMCSTLGALSLYWCQG